jgi:hypothetical protein
MNSTVRSLVATLMTGLAAGITLVAQADNSPISSPRMADAHIDPAQIPGWSADDLEFFLHGSLSTEIVPETVLRALVKTYPELFPARDFSHLGLIPDQAFGWPVGFSRARVAHLGGLSSVGINCAACHVAEVTSGDHRVRVLGATSHFDAEAFFGSIIGACFRTAAPENMKKFLSAYLAVNSPDQPDKINEAFSSQWQHQADAIAAAIAADPSGAKGLPSGALYPIQEDALRLDAANVEQADLAALSHSMLVLFHNMRAALHVPDEPPTQLPPASGPGRNDAFGLLSAVLFGRPQPYAPVKYGLVWNLENRPWVHWDGNTRSPLGRNLLASLGLGAPLIGHEGRLDFDLVQRQTRLSEKIQPPRYPFEVDRALVARGAKHYQAECASCHDGPENDTRLHDVAEIGTQPFRAQSFTDEEARLFSNLLLNLQTPGYQASSQPAIRSTRKYWAPSLAGVWARSPYLHNGSVRTVDDLLKPAGERAKSFHRGARAFDSLNLGYEDSGAYVLDTSAPANSNIGHEYGTDLPPEQKRELIEYLKTL